MVEHKTANGDVLGSIPNGGKRWLCPDMAEKLLTGMLKQQTNKQI